MILAAAADQGSPIAAQAFFYIAIAIAVIYFGYQFYKGAKENGGASNYGWLSGAKKKAGDPEGADGAAAGERADEAPGGLEPGDDASGEVARGDDAPGGLEPDGAEPDGGDTRR
ncbi:hypothetical protein RN607_08090 [Demequina capsici]|uniref:Uncharacterized protein n=1 Tax=Demequina capsici TaxID=3075620 RepID=A0AA96JEY9_9MICO|nr:hypothetical protein [Demequina sp. PMTSA13]WNM26159.1 hypothetical protein RN607_08090 [Demequina sp. PMTSA13]